MPPKTQKTVGDLAYEHGVHEDVVLDFADDHDVPTVGREFLFETEDEQQFEQWLEERNPTPDDDSADRDDDGELPADEADDAEAAADADDDD